jgi:uncharacterized protein YjbI with pentapeptide repeats
MRLSSAYLARPARTVVAAAAAAALVTVADPLLAQPAAASAITVNGYGFPDHPAPQDHANCPDADLPGANLGHIILDGANLRDTDLGYADLGGVGPDYTRVHRDQA